MRLLTLPAVDTLRLSPLAFPHNPYHRLVKHYQDGSLVRGRINNPELDARLALEVFGEQREALRKAEPDLLTAWHWLTTSEPNGVDRALDDFFLALRGAPRPLNAEARATIDRLLDGEACATHGREAVSEAATAGWALAYALAWLSVAGGDSVMPPWVPFMVYDGQQRLTTITLILKTLSRHLKDGTAPEGFGPDQIGSEYLVNPFSKGDQHYRLMLKAGMRRRCWRWSTTAPCRPSLQRASRMPSRSSRHASSSSARTSRRSARACASSASSPSSSRRAKTARTESSRP